MGRGQMSDRASAIVLTGQGRWVRELADGLQHYAGLAVGTAPFDRAAQALRPSAWRMIAGARTVVAVGFRPGAGTVRGILFDTAFALMRSLGPRERTIYYWIGSDVHNMLLDLKRGRPTRRLKRALETCEHFAGSRVLARELADAGIVAELVDFPWLGIPDDAGPLPLPARFTVLSYVPDARPAFYGGPQLCEAARALPSAEFLIVGGTGAWATDTPPNMRFLGWQEDMRSCYAASACVVRLVEHDSIGGTVVEGLAYGRPAVYSQPLEHTIHVTFGDVSRLVEVLRTLADGYAGTSTPPDVVASAWAIREFEPREDFEYLAARLLRTDTDEGIHGTDDSGMTVVDPQKGLKQ